MPLALPGVVRARVCMCAVRMVWRCTAMACGRRCTQCTARQRGLNSSRGGQTHTSRTSPPPSSASVTRLALDPL
eukprot:3801872-Pyramimonas_sp.AAC.1